MPDHPAVTLNVEALSPAVLAPFGVILGNLIQALEIHRRPRTPPDFWQEHLFDSRHGGEVEILWVNYRNDDPSVTILEKHVLPGNKLSCHC